MPIDHDGLTAEDTPGLTTACAALLTTACGVVLLVVWGGWWWLHAWLLAAMPPEAETYCTTAAALPSNWFSALSVQAFVERVQRACGWSATLLVALLVLMCGAGWAAGQWVWCREAKRASALRHPPYTVDDPRLTDASRDDHPLCGRCVRAREPEPATTQAVTAAVWLVVLLPLLLCVPDAVLSLRAWWRADPAVAGCGDAYPALWRLWVTDALLFGAVAVLPATGAALYGAFRVCRPCAKAVIGRVWVAFYERFYT